MSRREIIVRSALVAFLILALTWCFWPLGFRHSQIEPPNPAVSDLAPAVQTRPVEIAKRPADAENADKLAVLRLEVVDAESKKPITEFRVGVFPHAGDGAFSLAFQSMSGTAQLPVAQLPYSCQVIVYAREYEPSAKKTRGLPAELATTTLRFELVGNEMAQSIHAFRQERGLQPAPYSGVESEGTTQVLGRVTIGGIAPRGRVTLKAVNENPLSPWSQTVDLDFGGYFKILGVPQGAYEFEATAQSAQGETKQRLEQLEVPGNETVVHNVEFQLPSSLTGYLTGLQKGEHGGILVVKGALDLVNLTEDDLYEFGGMAVGEARTREDGTFEIRELDAGEYTVIAIAERYDSPYAANGRELWYTAQHVSIAPGQETSVAMRLD